MSLYVGKSLVSQKVQTIMSGGVKLPTMSEETNGQILSNDGENVEWVDSTTKIDEKIAAKADASTVTDLINIVNSKADEAETLAGYGIKDAYTKDEIDGKIASVFHYKGSVASHDVLPSADNVIGDVWNVEDTGANYAWTGSAWDKLSETVDLSSYATTSAMNTALENKQDKITKSFSMKVTYEDGSTETFTVPAL